MSMYRVIACVVGRGCLLRPGVLSAKVCSSLPCLILYTKAKVACYSGYLLISYFVFQCSVMKRTYFLVLVLDGHIGLQWTIKLLWQECLEHRLGLLWRRMVSLGNELWTFCCFWDAPRYCTLDSFVDYEGYYISSKGFLPTVVDIMVIWSKFTHSCPF